MIIVDIAYFNRWCLEHCSLGFYNAAALWLEVNDRNCRGHINLLKSHGKTSFMVT